MFAFSAFASGVAGCSDSIGRDDTPDPAGADASTTHDDARADPPAPPPVPPIVGDDAGSPVEPPPVAPPSDPMDPCVDIEPVVARAEMALIDNAATRTPPRLAALETSYSQLGLLFEHHYVVFDERVPGAAIFESTGDPHLDVYWSLRGAPIRASSYGGQLGAVVRDDDGRRLHHAIAPGEGALAGTIDPGEGRIAADLAATSTGWLSATLGAIEDPFGGFGALRVGHADLDGSAHEEGDYDAWFSSQLRDPQIVVGRSRAWLAVRTNVDFPYTVMLEEIDLATGARVPERGYPWGPGCGVDAFHVIAVDDAPVIVADCGGTTWLATGLETDDPSMQPIAEGTMQGSRVAWNGSDLMVATWRAGELAPRVQLRSISGEARSADIALPSAGVVSGEPRGLDASAIVIGPTWGVAFSVETSGGFEQSGVVYLARFRGCRIE